MMPEKPTISGAIKIVLTLALSLSPLPVLAGNMSASDLCNDSRIRKGAAEALGIWAQQFSFAKVLIGTDGRFGYVGPSRTADTEAGGVVCHATFNLVRASPTGRSYAVAINDYAFRVIPDGENGYTVSPSNLPDQVASDNEMLALLDRFTVDGQPYRTTIAENLIRLQRQKR